MTAKREKDQPAYPIGSVDKALRLVVMVAENPAGIRIGDAASMLDVAASTAHRLLQMLVHRGFARQDAETKMYHPGETLDRLSDQRERTRQIARPFLESLVGKFSETIHLSTLEGTQALTILSVESPHMLRVGNREGHAQPAARSGMGRVLLSGSTKETIDTALEADGADETRFAQSIDALQQQGYLVQHGEIEAGVSTVAVPVPGPAGKAPYAIGVTYPTGRIEEKNLPNLVQEMTAAAQRLSDELGS
ncbi:IclR family transcriptional regulator [Glutamicibacter uratoxydans]|uniref:IclR family transcriptional regulator n=1 Tax=Glutamicibacter uratoxydans TaxID=43667 RepID=UPI003D6FB5F5